ncbi:KPN_02809 family neutral zinc metallopeptidase [Ferrimonas marina]|uniref:Neutral zinc metallopeptidase n=1 Tax=Ferrimonas marina TaxID=299255 RepID=A0A1M5QY54_9GAMM|nr:neutral zinc metallopeptidase [Ferrimonas marina]SHH18871.1 hypothetical protein SAMN02745129_1403 [Ferrimonas marina]
MQWRGRKQSQNVQDRRGSGRRVTAGKGGLIGILILLAGWYFGIDPAVLFGVANLTGVGESAPTASAPPADDEAAQFTSVVLADTEVFWGNQFRQSGRQYQEPKLVLYRGQTQTYCGTGQSAMGPFYCPADATIYIDLSFYDELKQKLGAPGDFAQAYVVAHEVGHHVQNLLGISNAVHQRQQQMSKTEGNQESVKLELQADCFAGVWASYIESQQWLEQGDLAEAIQAAEAIGDDRLQQQSRGRVVPDSFTHGTSAQRMFWFQTGFDSGDPTQCDTFSHPSL